MKLKLFIHYLFFLSITGTWWLLFGSLLGLLSLTTIIIPIFLVSLTFIFVMLFSSEISFLFKNKIRLLLFIISYIIVTIIFFLFYILSLNGSPFIYEDSIFVYKKAEFRPLTLENKTFTTRYFSPLNNFGTVLIKFLPNEDVLPTLQESRFILRIAEEGQEPFYENTHTIYWVNDQPFEYPLGFPILHNSKDTIFDISLEWVDSTSENLHIASIKSSTDKADELTIRGRYIISKRNAFLQFNDVVQSILYKSQQIVEKELLPFLLIVFSLIIIFIWAWATTPTFTFLSKVTLMFATSAITPILFINYFLHTEEFIQQLILGDWYLLFLVFLASASNLWLGRKKLAPLLSSEIDQEKKDCLQQQGHFAKYFPLWNRLPIIGSILRWIYASGWKTILGLGGIFLIFSAMKAPAVNNLPTPGGTKHAHYTIAAKTMFEHNNPLLYQIRYQVDPVHNPLGTREYFTSPPVNQWGILATMYLFPQNTPEATTRLFTHFLGLLTLLTAYIFFAQWFTKIQSLLIVALIAINPIIIYLSYVPLEDTWLLLLSFSALSSLNNYIKNQKIEPLFLTGLLLGLGNLSKPSIFLWLMPIIFLMLFNNGRRWVASITASGTIASLSLLCIIAYGTSLRSLPSNLSLALSGFFIWIVVFFALYFFLKRHYSFIEKVVQKVFTHKILLFLIILVLPLFAMLFLYKFTSLHVLSGKFLTNTHLIFNWGMYWQMLMNQFRIYATPNIFYLGFLGGIVTILWNLLKQKQILIAFIAGSMTYWVMASQSMWFHKYYTHIIMVTLCIAAGTLIYSISKFLPKPFAFVWFLLIAIIVFPNSHQTLSEFYQSSREEVFVREVARYLQDYTPQNSIYIEERWDIRYFTALSGRPQTWPKLLAQDDVIQSIQQVGVKETMKKFNISVIITRNDTPSYVDYLPLFVPSITLCQPPLNDRTSRILMASKGEEALELEDNCPSLHSYVEAYNIPSKFTLVKEIGPWKIFEFTD